VRNEGDDNIPMNAFTLWNSFKLVMCYGLRQAGGAGDMFNSNLGERWIADVTFVLLILIIVFNLVGGIIIMTFSVLREEKAQRQENTVNICFICGIERAEFDRASAKGDGFKLHIRFDHNMWNYVRFMIFLWEQDRDDDDGLEQYVRRAIAANDLNWFPMNKAIRLEAARGNEEDLVKTLKNRITNVDKNLSNRLAVVQSEVNIVLEQVSQALKQEHMTANEGDELQFQPSMASLMRAQHQRSPSPQHHDFDDIGDVEDLIEFDGKQLVGGKPEKPVYIELRSISGFDEGHSSHEPNVYVTLTVDGEIHNINCTQQIGDVLIFNSQRMCMSRHATIEDTQICRLRVYKRHHSHHSHIHDSSEKSVHSNNGNGHTSHHSHKQLHIGHGVHHSHKSHKMAADGSLEDENVTANGDVLLGYADYTYSELVFGDGLCIDKYFVNVREPWYYCMTVFTTSVGQMHIK
jgi:hypothetical protein